MGIQIDPAALTKVMIDIKENAGSDEEAQAAIQQVQEWFRELEQGNPSPQAKRLYNIVRKENGKPNFNWGDRVQIIATGQIGTVISRSPDQAIRLHGSPIYTIELPNGQYEMDLEEHELRRVKSYTAKENSKPNFRVGDRVNTIYTQGDGTWARVVDVQPQGNSFTYGLQWTDGNSVGGTIYNYEENILRRVKSLGLSFSQGKSLGKWVEKAGKHGQFTDKLGRKICYNQGKRTPCNQLPGAKPQGPLPSTPQDSPAKPPKDKLPDNKQEPEKPQKTPPKETPGKKGKKEKPSVESTLERIRSSDPGDSASLAQSLGSHTVAELDKIASELGLGKLKGNKGPKIQQIVDDVMSALQMPDIDREFPEDTPSVQEETPEEQEEEKPKPKKPTGRTAKEGFRPSVDDSVANLEGGYFDMESGVEILSQHTVKELDQIAAKLGIKAKGNKTPKIQAIISQVLDRIGRPAEPEEIPEPEALHEEMPEDIQPTEEPVQEEPQQEIEQPVEPEQVEEPQQDQDIEEPFSQETPVEEVEPDATPQPPEPGFTGKDRSGHCWEDGEMVPCEQLDNPKYDREGDTDEVDPDDFDQEETPNYGNEEIPEDLYPNYSREGDEEEGEEWENTGEDPEGWQELPGEEPTPESQEDKFSNAYQLLGQGLEGDPESAIDSALENMSDEEAKEFARSLGIQISDKASPKIVRMRLERFLEDNGQPSEDFSGTDKFGREWENGDLVSDKQRWSKQAEEERLAGASGIVDVEPKLTGKEADSTIQSRIDSAEISGRMFKSKKEDYVDSIHRTMIRMPRRAKDLLASNLSKVILASSIDDVQREADKRGGGGGRTAAFYDPISGTLCINGGVATEGKDSDLYQLPDDELGWRDQIYPHELGHVIDGTRFSFSGHIAWKDLCQGELANGKLTEYANTSPMEAFAEFSRLVYGGIASLESVETKFPGASEFFRKNGLWPDEGGEGKAVLDDIFDPDEAPTPDAKILTDSLRQPPEPGFSGKDDNGHCWRDGEMIPCEELDNATEESTTGEEQPREAEEAAKEAIGLVGITDTLPDESQFDELVDNLLSEAEIIGDSSKSSAYGQTLRQSLGNMPVKARALAIHGLKKIKLYSDIQDLRDEWARLENLDPRDVSVIAWYEKGELVIDGGGDPGDFSIKSRVDRANETQLRAEIYCHELGHSIDRYYRFSGHKVWKNICGSELANGTLTGYANTNNQEAFAEFCRLLYNGSHDLNEIESKYPETSKFFKNNDLWPEQNGDQPATLVDRFDADKETLVGETLVDSLVQPPEPGFSGKDDNGHCWRNGIMIPCEEMDDVGTEEPITEQEQPGEPGVTGDGEFDETDSGGMEEEVGRSDIEDDDTSWEDESESAGGETPGRVPARLSKIAEKLNRYENLFRKKGMHQQADWMGQLWDHIQNVGVQSALDSLGEEQEEEEHAPLVYMTGKGTLEQRGGKFVTEYLKKVGITSIDEIQDLSETVNVSPRVQEFAEYWYGEPDFAPTSSGFENKLDEAKHLPGLEATEDISVLMGRDVSALTDDVINKFNEVYGENGWLVKPYAEETARAGFGIFFPQRVRQLTEEARAVIWDSGGPLGQYGFSHLRDDSGKIVGIRHEDGSEYPFDSDHYRERIDGDVRYWGDRVQAAAENEKGIRLPNNGKNFMVQPAFQAVGVTEQERAEGKTIVQGEARVHITTDKSGNVKVIPHSTWIKGEPLPVVFENEDTKAIAKAAEEAIRQLPKNQRSGQLFAPDIMKTENGYKVIELNSPRSWKDKEGDVIGNTSGYLNDNPLIIDAYVSSLVDREPGHIKFIRQLLTDNKKGKNNVPGKSGSGRGASGKVGQGDSGQNVPGGTTGGNQQERGASTGTGGFRSPGRALRTLEQAGVGELPKGDWGGYYWDLPEHVKHEYDRNFTEAAKKGGYYIPPDKLPDILRTSPNVGGHEHDVHQDAANNVYYKLTRNTPTGQNGSPAEYLRRHEVANELWPSLGYQLVGVTNDQNGTPQFVMRMNRISGFHPEQNEISQWFRNHGFEPVDNPNDDEARAWRDPTTGTVISDAHAGNFLKNEGGLAPIDVNIWRPPVNQKSLRKQINKDFLFKRYGPKNHLPKRYRKVSY